MHNNTVEVDAQILDIPIWRAARVSLLALLMDTNDADRGGHKTLHILPNSALNLLPAFSYEW